MFLQCRVIEMKEEVENLAYEDVTSNESKFGLSQKRQTGLDKIVGSDDASTSSRLRRHTTKLA